MKVIISLIIDLFKIRKNNECFQLNSKIKLFFIFNTSYFLAVGT